jgi:hypothetical protein
MNTSDQNTEYEHLSIQPWEIEGAEEFNGDSFEANTQHDQQADQSYEYSS